MKIKWCHNFNKRTEATGCFMFQHAKYLEELGYDIELEYLGNLRSLSQCLKAKNKIINEKYDIVHAQFGSMCGYLVAKTPSPKIITIRGSDWYNLKGGKLKVKLHGKLQSLLTRISLKKYDHVIVVSERMKKDIEKIFPAHKISILPSPVDLTKFCPMDKMEARQKLGMGKDTASWILFPVVDVDNPIKRYSLAKEAVRIASKTKPNIKLKIVHGINPRDMPLYYNAADTTLLTSCYEGWPNSIKESLACNIPFVATDVSDLRKIADDEPACRVTEDNASSLAKAIIEVLDYSSHNKLALRRHVEQMNLENITGKLISIYQSVARKANAFPVLKTEDQ